MTARIVFNGREYDTLEAMPPDVRAQYQAVLDALAGADRSKVESLLGQGAGIRINTTVKRRFKINGREYDSVEAMPPEVRSIYERAAAGAAGESIAEPARATLSAAPVLPPPTDADDSRAGTIFRVALLVVGLALVLVWVLLRR